MDTLDLHGTLHDEAEYKIHKFIYRSQIPCKIITGHSQRMKEIVRAVISEYDLKCHYESCINFGSLIVTDK
ncbi:hypothetical protein CMI47_17305 [Candidatus Pacearchaeota archaeon]|nr:hypothetical protein [Candidatus Pacearchaeota archaeon]